MWVFTQYGFISAVDNGHVPGKLAIRARDKKSLEFLAALTEQTIAQNKGSDYPYRVFVTKQELADYLVAQVEDIDYSNFKDRVYASRGGKFAGACGKVWAAMLDVTDKEAVGTGLYS